MTNIIFTISETRRWLLGGLVLFNAVEAVIQFMGGITGTALPVIFGNVVLHAAMAIACLVGLLRVHRTVAESTG